MSTRPVLRYHGGKWRLAPWIIEHFPAHRIYVEPFAGAASVLMRKPRVYSEVINDLDGEVVNVFRVLQCPESARRLEELLLMTPFAREEYELAYYEADNPVEQARRTIIRAFMGFGSAAVTGQRMVREKDQWNRPSTGFRSNSSRSGTTPAHDWARYPEQLRFYCERLAGVVIENRPALEVVAQHDGPDTLFYCDPPYPLSTRDAGADYRFEMSDVAHRELASVLHQVSGMVVLSGYACPLYSELFGDWHQVTKAALADGALKRTETLWFNGKAAKALNGRLFV